MALRIFDTNSGMRISLLNLHLGEPESVGVELTVFNSCFLC